MVPALPSIKEGLILSFLEVGVGQTTDTARMFLEAAQWVVDDALELFYMSRETDCRASSSLACSPSLTMSAVNCHVSLLHSPPQIAPEKVSSVELSVSSHEFAVSEARRQKKPCLEPNSCLPLPLANCMQQLHICEPVSKEHKPIYSSPQDPQLNITSNVSHPQSPIHPASVPKAVANVTSTAPVPYVSPLPKISRGRSTFHEVPSILPQPAPPPPLCPTATTRRRKRSRTEMAVGRTSSRQLAVAPPPTLNIHTSVHKCRFQEELHPSITPPRRERSIRKAMLSRTEVPAVPLADSHPPLPGPNTYRRKVLKKKVPALQADYFHAPPPGPITYQCKVPKKKLGAGDVLVAARTTRQRQSAHHQGTRTEELYHWPTPPRRKRSVRKQSVPRSQPTPCQTAPPAPHQPNHMFQRTHPRHYSSTKRRKASIGKALGLSHCNTSIQAFLQRTSASAPHFHTM